MSTQKSKLARRIYSVCLAALIAVIAFFLILFCVFIFRSGDKPFTREIIGSYLSRLAIPSAICLVGVLLAPVFYAFFPVEKEKLRSKRDVYVTLRRVFARLDEKNDGIIVSERKKRLVLRVLCVILCALSFVPAAVYLLTPSNFPGNDTSAEVLTLACAVLACAAVSATVFLTLSFFARKSAERELLRVKELLKAKNNGTAPSVSDENTAKRFPALTVVRVCVLVLGVTLVVLGLLNGGNRDVLGKAINICYECIGLG